MSDEKKDKPAGGGGRSQRRIRNLLIDKKYQLRYALISVLIGGVLCGSLTAVVIWQTRAATSQLAAQRNSAAKSYAKLSKALTDSFQILKGSEEEMVKVAATEAWKMLKAEDLAREKKKREDNRLALERRKTSELILIIAIIFVGLLFLGFIFILNILITHKVAGPMFKMGRYMDRIREGALGQVYDLRKGDQLVDFYERFKQMHSSLRDECHEDIKVMEEALAVCREKGLDGGAVDNLASRVDAKRESLESN